MRGACDNTDYPIGEGTERELSDLKQLSLWDAPKQVSKAQVELVRCEDGGYDVLHILSGLFVCHFRPIFVKKADAELYCDMLADIDLDAYWLAGCPDDGTPRRVGGVMREWQKRVFPGVFVNMNDIQRLS